MFIFFYVFHFECILFLKDAILWFVSFFLQDCRQKLLGLTFEFADFLPYKAPASFIIYIFLILLKQMIDYEKMKINLTQ